MADRTAPQVSDWLREEARHLGEYSERARDAMRQAATTIREQGELIRTLSQQNNELRERAAPPRAHLGNLPPRARED